MYRTAFVLAGIIALTASAAWAAYVTLPVDDLSRPVPGTAAQDILIRVPQSELSRCMATLAQVLTPPVEMAGLGAAVEHGTATAGVRCIAE